MQPHSRSRTLVYIVSAVTAVVFATGWLLMSGVESSASGVVHIGPVGFMEALKGDSAAILVDVRTPQEFAEGHLPGAVNVELDRLPDLAPGLLPDKNAHLLVYCRSGNRSGFAVSILDQMGYSRLVNMTGGIVQWSQKGYPVTRN